MFERAETLPPNILEGPGVWVDEVSLGDVVVEIVEMGRGDGRG